MAESNNEFQDAVVIITGAGSGIGAATAVAFAKLGAILSIADLSQDGLKATTGKCQQVANSIKVLETVGDLCNESIREKLVNNTVANFGQINILVNCAGLDLYDSVLNYNSEAFDTLFNINLKAPYHLSNLCAQHLIKTKGCIVNISSTAVKIVVGKELSYSMSKAAMNCLTKHAATELGPYGVRVNAISPGIVLTNIHGKPRHIEIEQNSSRHLLNRCAEPEEVADLIVYLASNKAAYMTGSNIKFDGGLVIKKLRQ